MTLDGKQGKIAYKIMLEHLGHNIVVVLYDGQNAAVECETCYVVMFDSDNPNPARLRAKLREEKENLRVERPDLFEGDPTPPAPLTDAELEEIALCTKAGPHDIESVRKLGAF
jgi:hypothetical protein